VVSSVTLATLLAERTFSEKHMEDFGFHLRKACKTSEICHLAVFFCDTVLPQADRQGRHRQNHNRQHEKLPPVVLRLYTDDGKHPTSTIPD
jgi:hypothetical protein